MIRKSRDRDISATQIELDHGINPGLWQSSLLPGLVSLFEEHSARLERGISIDAWMQMDIDEKAMIIAVRRIANAVKNLLTEAEIREAKSKHGSPPS